VNITAWNCRNLFKKPKKMEEIEKMLEFQLLDRGINDERVLESMRMTDRRHFVPDSAKHLAYSDSALPIGRGQTISQPYIVAYMAQKLDIGNHHRVLEIGTGCGYNAAVLSKLSAMVYSVEIIEWLARLADRKLSELGIGNIKLKRGDGSEGWPEEAPFDRIMLTASPKGIPPTLTDQLKRGGKLIAPVKNHQEKLVLLEKISDNEFIREELIPVRFVPMTGRWHKGD
jgi:protein-L-isoaspartate(D-aspartate) O-methyltransferase